MFRWNKQLLIDLACHPDLTVLDISTRIGCSKSSVEKKLRGLRTEILAARLALNISEKLHCKVLDMWADGVAEVGIAAATGLSGPTVRRLIMISQIDEEASDADMAEPMAMAA